MIESLRAIVGRRHVLVSPRRTERYRKGYRSGEGKALAVVRPGSLLEQWQALEVCVAAEVIVIMQAANTGLTEGSTPKGVYDREVVLINTCRIDGIQPLNGGRQVIALAGATLFALEKILTPLGRQPHSVIGSSCIGASIVGGVCNNSGGALIERGPSYTELSLFAQASADRQLRLVNRLGVDLGETPAEILSRLEAGDYAAADITANGGSASDTEYSRHVRDIAAKTPARFNADKRRLFDASGCAGKLAVFAVRLDTFPLNRREKVFYIGTNRPDDLTELRCHVLANFKTLPVSAEYMHRECYDIADRYGKDTVVLIDKIGTARLPVFFGIKGILDASLDKFRLTRGLTDRFMQVLARLWPDVLPNRVRDFRRRFAHHLILKAHDDGIDEASAYLNALFAQSSGEFFACNEREARIVGLHRFAAAGAAVRYKAIHYDKIEDILALDIALPRNAREWFEALPADVEEKLIHKLYYGHFLCHVLHQDYIVKKGTDMEALKARILARLDERGVEYPAEHNVGHLYAAKPDLAAFYRRCDPYNTFNPGIGGTSRKRDYGQNRLRQARRK